MKRFVKDGNGVIIKSLPKLDNKFSNKILEHNPDKIFILDIAMVEQKFVDDAKCKVIWIDHHQPQSIERVKIYNPRLTGKSVPTTYMCYQIANQDLWIAVIGCVADWYIPEFIEEFRTLYPELIRGNPKIAPDIIYNEPLGKLIRIFNFILKGKRTSEIYNYIAHLSKVQSPYEILRKETEHGKLVFEKGERVEKEYLRLLERTLENVNEDKIIYFEYTDADTSFTSEVSNELIYRYPDKIVIIAREKDDEMRLSIRATKVILPPILNKALLGLDGYGGGHEHACGACIKKRDFEVFLERFKCMF